MSEFMSNTMNSANEGNFFMISTIEHKILPFFIFSHKKIPFISAPYGKYAISLKNGVCVILCCCCC